MSLCGKGLHEMTVANTFEASTPNGGRTRKCRACRSDRERALRQQATNPAAWDLSQRLRELLGPQPNTEWMADAACRGLTDLFYLERGDHGGREDHPAKLICGECPVQEPCLSYAMAGHERYGVWGKTSPTDRRRIAQRRGVA